MANSHALKLEFRAEPVEVRPRGQEGLLRQVVRVRRTFAHAAQKPAQGLLVAIHQPPERGRRARLRRKRELGVGGRCNHRGGGGIMVCNRANTSDAPAITPVMIDTIRKACPVSPPL